MECVFCKTVNSSSALYCVNCNQSISFKCKNCSHRLPGKTKFCSQCGTEVNDESYLKIISDYVMSDNVSLLYDESKIENWNQSISFKCRNCSCTLPIKTKFCSQCGTKLNDNQQQEAKNINLSLRTTECILVINELVGISYTTAFPLEEHMRAMIVLIEGYVDIQKEIFPGGISRTKISDDALYDISTAEYFISSLEMIGLRANGLIFSISKILSNRRIGPLTEYLTLKEIDLLKEKLTAVFTKYQVGNLDKTIDPKYRIGNLDKTIAIDKDEFLLFGDKLIDSLRIFSTASLLLIEICINWILEEYPHDNRVIRKYESYSLWWDPLEKFRDRDNDSLFRAYLKNEKEINSKADELEEAIINNKKFVHEIFRLYRDEFR